MDSMNSIKKDLTSEAQEILKSKDAAIDIVVKHLERLDHHKKYRVEKKDKLNEYMRNYYDNNKETWKRNSEKMECDVCKKTFASSYYTKHVQSQYHKRRMEK